MICPVFCLVLYTIHAAIHIFLVWNLRGAIIIPLLEGQKTHRGVEKHALGDTSKGLNLLMSRVRFCPWNIQVLPLFSASAPFPSSEAFTLPPAAHSWISIPLTQDEFAYLSTVVNHNHTHCATCSGLSPYVSRYHTRFPSTFEMEQKAKTDGSFFCIFLHSVTG